MFKNDKSNSEVDSNFWISYADLMAGLLFVFILLIGAIVVKSSILKNKLHNKENSLAKTEALVNKKDAYILEKDRLLAQKKEALEKEKSHLSKTQLELQRKNARLVQGDLLLSKNERLLKLKLNEINRLNKLLVVSNTKVDKLSGKIVIVQTLLDEKENNLTKTKATLAQEKEALKAYEGKVLVLSNELTQAKASVKLKDDKLLSLLTQVGEKKTKYDALIEKLQEQKSKIKSLTGIKLQVVASLKKALGSKINIDKKTGSLKLASNILFEVGKSTLKNEAKVELKKAFEEYIGTLVTDENIKPHLDKIIIEGHTDSDGSYLLNLKLSQERALAVMEYLLTLDFAKKHNIKQLMLASGRAYLDAIKKNGVEDKEASRRIEIKFRLKNEDAMHEIEKVLDAK